MSTIGHWFQEYLHCILRNRYFSRLWVVQEVLLAKKVEIVCGDVWIDWHHIEGFVIDADAVAQHARAQMAKHRDCFGKGHWRKTSESKAGFKIR